MNVPSCRGRVFINRVISNSVTYYVAASGDDSYDGLTTGTAWKTLTKVNSAVLNPGDSVLFKAGETFTGQLAPTRNGTSYGWITYGSYGAGARPVIDGSSANCAFKIDTAVGHYSRFEHLDFKGSSGIYSSIYCYNTHDIYFYDCIGRDASARHGCAISSTGTPIYNITVDACIFNDNYMSGLLCATPYSQNIQIKNKSYAHHNGHDTSGDHGFYVGFGVVVDDCDADHNSAAGFKMNDNEQSPTGQYPVVKNSRSTLNNYGIIITHGGATAYNNLVYANVTNMAIYGNTWGGYKVYHNTFVNGTSADTRSITFSLGVSPNSEFKNNLFIQDASVVSRANLHFDAGLSMSSYASMFNNNTYFYSTTAPTTQHIIYSAGDAGNLMDWTEWRAAGAEANGTLLTAQPDFVVKYSDLNPMIGGNLLGLATAITGYDKDANGVTRTSPPTPGCYDDPKPELVSFVSAEAGSARANIVRVVFSTKILASNYSTGVTIKVNGATATISSSSREASETVVRYTLSANVQEGQTVTWEYSEPTGNYSNTSQTYDLPTYTAQSVTNNVVNTLIDIDLETNNLTQFSSVVSDDVSASATAALNGTSYGLQVVLDDLTATYGIKNITASLTGVLRASLYIDPNSLTMGANHMFYIVDFRNGTTAFGHLELNYNGGFAIRGAIYNDSGTPTESTRQYITDAPRLVEIKFTRASSNVASDGRMDVYVDGVGTQSITGIDNYDRFNQFSQLYWGATGGIDSGTSGTFYMDEMLINDTGNAIRM